MNVKALYKQRKKEDWTFQWSIIGMVIDWTIALYIIIPSFIFFGIGYKHVLHDPPLVLKSIPYLVGIILFYVIAIRTNFRSYLKEADQLFLIQRKDVIDTLVNYGQWRFIRMEAIKGFLLMALVLPFFLLHMPLLPYVQFSIVIILWRIVYGLYHFKWLNTKKVMWLRFSSFFLFVGTHMYRVAFVEWIVIGLLVGVFFFLFPRITFDSSMFYGWLAFENKKRNRLLNMVFKRASSYDSVVKDTLTKEKPPVSLFFKESNRLFTKRTQRNVLLETFIKWILRRPKKITPLLQVTFLTCSAMMLISNGVKFIVLALCLIAIKGVVSGILYEFFNNPFLKLYKWKEQLTATQTLSFYLTCVSMCLPTIVALITFFF